MSATSVRLTENSPWTASRTARNLPLRAWVDIAVLTALSTLGILGFAPSFTDSSYLIAGLGGLMVGTAAGVAASILRLGPVTTVLLAAVAYFLFGSALAMPQQATALVIPNLESLSGLALGAVFGWADMVTLTAPVAAPDYIGVLPYVAATVVGLISSTIAGRVFARRRRSAVGSLLALLAPVTVYVVSVLTGTDQPYLAALRGIAFALIAIVWMSWRVPENANASSANRRAVVRQKFAGVAVIAVVAIAGGVVLGGAAAPPSENRFVLRDKVQPPFDPTLYPSPLSGFRAYLKEGLRDEVLFTATGLEEGDHIRIATMDSYDGALWSVTGPEVATDGSGTFRLVSGELPAVPLSTAGRDVSASIVIQKYRDVWIPTVGYPENIVFSAGATDSSALRYNTATGIAVDIDRLGTGADYSFTAVTQDQNASGVEDAAVASVSLPPTENVPDFIGSKASEWSADAETPFDKITAITAQLNEGFLSHGREGEPPSSAGHGADRMRRLLDGKEAMVGDQEQYASALALMARYLGYPARVVMGFAPEVAADGTAEVLGENVDAWVEVAFDGIGWVSFFPTPTDMDVPTEQAPKPKSKPQPLVRQPPRSDTAQDDLVSAVEIDDSDDEERFVIPRWVWIVAAAVGIPLALFFIPFFVVASIKARRRRRRRGSGPADRRAAGAWDELVDRYAELGYQAPREATRVQLALLFEQQFQSQLNARDGERNAAAMRAESRIARAAAKAGRAETTGSAPKLSARPAMGALVEATVVRAKDASTWRPGVAAADDPLPAIPGLRDFAVASDAAVFSGGEIDDAAIDTLWTQSDNATLAARRSVSWYRRRLSRFRIRSRTDVVAGLVARMNAAASRTKGPRTA